MEKVRLEEVCEILDSKRIPITASERVKGEYPYYGANGIQGYINDYIFDDELVLLAEDGGNFGSKVKPIAYKVSGKCWVNNHAHVLKANSKIITTDFLCYSLMFYDVTKIVNGTTRIKLTQSAMRKMELYLPSLEIQNKITSLLVKIQKILENKRKILGNLDLLSKCLFEKELGNLRANEKNWRFTALQNICDVRDGTHDSPKYVAEGYPLITSKNILEDKIDFFNVNYISKLDLEKINKRSKVDRGDILMPMIGTIGNPLIVDVEKEFAIKNVALLKFDKLKQDNIFIKEILSSNYFLSIIKEKNRGGTQKFLSLNDIRNISIPIVPEEVKAKIISTSNLVQKSKFLFKNMELEIF